MAGKDLYEELVKSYEFMLGRMPNHDRFKAALKETLTEQDIRLIFLLPFIGEVPMEKFMKRAQEKLGIAPEELEATVRRLVPEGFISSFLKTPKELVRQGEAPYPQPAPLADLRQPNRVVRRGEIISLLELQVRKHEEDAMRNACAEYFNLMTEDAARSIPTRTPYFRVMPVEHTLTGKTVTEEIVVNVPIPDPREVLPIDLLSEMLKREPIIALAECYCRRTKIIVGEPCEHPLQTCFYFNELALMQIETGRAQQITYDQAMRILRECEQAGLVHNASNCEGHLNVLCNCCTCSCGAMKSILYGRRNASGPSRYVVAYDDTACSHCNDCAAACPIGVIHSNGSLTVEFEKCIGCGLCVSKCPTGSLKMELRGKPPKIFKDWNTLQRQQITEVVTGTIRKKLIGK